MKRSDCPITCTLDLLGDKWTLIILRDAIFSGYTTYGQFQSSTEKIATNILAARLQKLVEEGIFTKATDENNKRKIHYNITPKGATLKEVLLTVGLWGSEHIEGTIDMAAKIKAVQNK